MNTKAMYQGSFDPFTVGHLDVVRKAAKLFDELYVVIGINASKKRATDPELMRSAIENALSQDGLDNVHVAVFDGLMVDFAREYGIGYMVRGLRNSVDYAYEENIAEINKLLAPEIEYVYFRAENVAVSSSMVKELRAHGKDISAYLPKAVFDIM